MSTAATPLCTSHQPDPRSGYCATTKSYFSLRPAAPLPSPDLPIYLPDYIFSSLGSHASSSRPAFIDAFTGVHVSYSQLSENVRALSGFLHYAGIQRGQAILLISPNAIYVPVIALAVLSVGAVLTATNPSSTVSDVSHQCQLSEPVLAFVDSSSVHLPPKTLPHPPIVIDSDEFLTILQPNRSPSFPGREKNQLDTATVLYSSGTTGPVKGVVSTHRNHIALAAVLQSVADPNKKPGATLVTVPMFHIFGFLTVTNLIARAETLVFMERFDMGTLLLAIQTYRVRYLPVSPPLLLALARLGTVNRFDLSSLEHIRCAGAPLRKEVIDRFVSRFPNVSVVQGYGLTETTGGISHTIGPEEISRYGSVGKLDPHAQAKIVDPHTGTPLPPGLPGELWLRGPTIMKGYMDDEQATSSCLNPQGWLKTGDLCYFDEDGFLFVVDRLKELIKYKGYQVAPVELEQLLQSHPEVLDAAVIPYPDEDAGEIPMAFVVRQTESNLSEEQVTDFVAKQVAPYKKVRRVAFVDFIPKSAAGKIQRRDLVKQALQNSQSRL